MIAKPKKTHPSSAPQGTAEADLVRRAAGDPDAFAELYRRHYPAIQRYLRRRLGDPHIVEDTVAETFMGALKALPRYEDRGLPFQAWLYRIATLQANQQRRKAARIAMQQLELEPEALPDEDGPSAEAVRAALLQIAARYQEVIALHYFEHFDLQQISTTLGVQIGTVKSRLSRGRDALRHQLVKMGIQA